MTRLINFDPREWSLDCYSKSERDFLEFLRQDILEDIQEFKKTIKWLQNNDTDDFASNIDSFLAEKMYETRNIISKRLVENEHYAIAKEVVIAHAKITWKQERNLSNKTDKKISHFLYDMKSIEILKEKYWDKKGSGEQIKALFEDYRMVGWVEKRTKGIKAKLSDFEKYLQSLDIEGSFDYEKPFLWWFDNISLHKDIVSQFKEMISGIPSELIEEGYYDRVINHALNDIRLFIYLKIIKNQCFENYISFYK